MISKDNNDKKEIEAVIGLGSNLNNPEKQINDAIIEIGEIAGVKVVKKSSLFHSCPVGPQDQPDFVNAVIIVSTSLAPEVLLDNLQKLEQDHRRVRLQHWGPRTLDLDILFYGNEVIATERLSVPHPEILNRVFVVIPLLEIAPNFTLPNGVVLKNCVNSLPKKDMEFLRKV